MGPGPDRLRLDALSLGGCCAADDLNVRGSGSFNWGPAGGGGQSPPPEGAPLLRDPFERAGAGRSGRGICTAFRSGSGSFCTEGGRELRDSEARPSEPPGGPGVAAGRDGPSRGYLGLIAIAGPAPDWPGGLGGGGSVSAPSSPARPRPFPARSDAWRQSPSEPRPLSGRNIYACGPASLRRPSDTLNVSETDNVRRDDWGGGDRRDDWGGGIDPIGSRSSSFSHGSSHWRDHSHASSGTLADVERGNAEIQSWLSMSMVAPPAGAARPTKSLRPAAGYGWPAP